MQQDSSCRPILSRSEHVIGALGSCPMDDNWDEVNEQLIPIFDLLGKHYRFSKSQHEHRRGAFNAVTCGISYGGGQQRVANLAQTPHNQAVLDGVMCKCAVHCIANFGGSVMCLLAPHMFETYNAILEEVCAHDTCLRCNFPGNPFAAATFNVSLHTVTYGHMNHLNPPNGMCSITTIGNFDPTLGEHLVLWDLKLVIEFPPGSTILIPSALLKHSNICLHDTSNEFRHSFVQYSVGGIFRWVECGHQSQKDFKTAGHRYKETGKQRWQRGLALFSKWSDLFPGM
ncbi:hypothetical protein LXA43DRAFT_904329 [Ganoderma leucocontextum]|nr:hypothetical protein LXA43DRAFT_904329 [Ganoderma leucocontextum]